MAIKHLILACGLMLVAAQVSAATYTATPGTMAGQLGQVRPGDTLLLSSGHYPSLDQNAMALPSGTAGARITIAAAPGASVTMPAITVTKAQYLTFRNLTLTRGTSVTNVASSHPPKPGSNFLRFENLHIRWTPGAVSATQSTPNFVFSNGNVYQNVTVHGSYHLGDGRSHGYYINGAHNRVEGGSITAMSGYGVQVYNGYTFEDAHDNVIRGVTITNVGGPRNAGGIVLSSGANNQALGNTIQGLRYGMGVQVNYQCRGCVVAGNRIEQVPGYGVEIGQDARGTIVQGNTMRGTAGGIRNGGQESRIDDGTAIPSGGSAPPPAMPTLPPSTRPRTLPTAGRTGGG